MRHFRDRIVEFRRVPASELLPHPDNWRTHPEAQRETLAGVLDEIGFAGAVLARRLDDGRLQLIDGHLRVETAGDQLVPVLILDVTADEADKLLLTFDPLSAMAQTDEEKLRELAARVDPQHPQMRSLCKQLEETAQPARPSSRSKQIDFEPLFQVIVECCDEQQQQELFERLSKDGLRCRLMML